MTEVRQKTLYVRRGKVVVVEYVVKLSTGKVVDSSEKAGGPVTFICGEGNLPAPVEEGLVGLAPGEKKTIEVSSDYTYGSYDPLKVALVGIERIAGNPQVGKIVKVLDEFGLRRPALVRSIWEGATLIDFNHPLAGKTLYFDVFVIDVRIPQESNHDHGDESS